MMVGVEKGDNVKQKLRLKKNECFEVKIEGKKKFVDKRLKCDGE